MADGILGGIGDFIRRLFGGAAPPQMAAAAAPPPAPAGTPLTVMNPQQYADLVARTPQLGPSVQPPGRPAFPPAQWQAAGAPASMAYMPPSMFTGSSPAQQALWNQASTPQGYQAMQRQAIARLAGVPPAGGPGAAMAPVPPPKPTPPPLGNVAPATGGSLSPFGPTPPGAGMPGTQSGPAQSGPALSPALQALANVPPSGGGGAFGPGPPGAGMPGTPAGPGVAPPAPAGSWLTRGAWGAGPGGPALAQPLGAVPPPPAPAPRAMSDEAIAGLRPEDVGPTMLRNDLTPADLRALMPRLQALSGQFPMGSVSP